MKWNIAQVKQEISGPAALVQAPFNDDLSLNTDHLRRNIQYIMEGGLKNGQGFLICPCGSGEYQTLSVEEHKAMVETAIKTTDGKLPVVVGIGSIDIRKVLEMGKNAKKAGAKYTMIAPPFYDSIDQNSIYEWYRELAGKLDLGIMIYDQSWRGALGTGLTIPLMDRLADLDNIVSLKYGSPNLFEDTIVALERFSDRFAFLENSLAYTAVLAAMHGGTAFVSSTSCWWPEFEIRFFQMIQKKQYAEADKWHTRLAPYFAWFQGEFWRSQRFFHASALIKASMEYVDLYGGPLRPPFRALNAAEKKDLWAMMEKMGVRKTGQLITEWDMKEWLKAYRSK